MIALICGSRDWTEREPLRCVLVELRASGYMTIVHGDNGYDQDGKMLHGRPDEEAVKGADKLTGAIAAELGFEVLREPALWKQRGRKAGPERNQRMLDKYQPQQVVAFTKDITQSNGTADMVRRARLAGVQVRIEAGE